MITLDINQDLLCVDTEDIDCEYEIPHEKIESVAIDCYIESNCSELIKKENKKQLELAKKVLLQYVDETGEMPQLIKDYKVEIADRLWEEYEDDITFELYERKKSYL